MKVDEYLLEDGSSPYKKWFDGLDVEAAAKVTHCYSAYRAGANIGNQWFDGIGEYIIDWGPGYRIYLAQDGKDLIILFGGGTKKGQNEDIKEAKRLHEEYKVRKAAKAKAEKEKAEKEKSSKIKKTDKKHKKDKR
ncbi:MAG: hypothetical protein K2X77_33835 [Candidatus Obscuribacterales bacterium]|jgi:putative addiction module killer protein|nr:hypothetical protein [Candidatus Obscuribacterales bacterium]